ncbi:hypothetical protein ACIP79_41185 [Streptomyces sp. NPDC088747]|uniref:hypothetical protein n=1 Tax=Streptomyces sp. NPDC088747 TaxID=3365886 RepID=UPI003811252E
MAHSALPGLLRRREYAAQVGSDVQAVLAELIDVTARRRVGAVLEAALSCDGAHIRLTVGHMNRLLPGPSSKPGLYVVHDLADHVGQYLDAAGGRVTWAAVPA